MCPCSEAHRGTWKEHGQSVCADTEGDWDWWLNGQMMCMIQSHFTKILVLLTHLRCLLGTGSAEDSMQCFLPWKMDMDPGELEMNKYMFHFVYVPIAGIVFSNQSRTINYCFINGARLFILLKNIYVLGIHSHRHTDTQSSI